jgi:hypothetical protein
MAMYFGGFHTGVAGDSGLSPCDAVCICPDIIRVLLPYSFVLVNCLALMTKALGCFETSGTTRMQKHMYRPFAAYFERKSLKTYCGEKGKQFARRMEIVLGPRGVS